MNNGCRIRINEGVFVQQVDEQLVLFDMESGEYFGLDEAGREIWGLMGETPVLGELCRILAERYDAPYDLIYSDVRGFVAQLVQKGLVVTEGCDSL